VTNAVWPQVWGESIFVTKALPVFIALSSLGNVFAQSFAMPRVKQELAKEGLLPFSRFFASDWPLNAPTGESACCQASQIEIRRPANTTGGTGAIFLHWLFSVILILGSLTSDTYTFVTNIFIYTSNWIKVLLGVGLLLLTFKPSLGWKEQRTSFRSYPLLTIFWLTCLLFVLAAPFIPNSLLASIPYYVVPALGTGMLAVGVLYWVVWAKLLPLLGFHIQHEIIQLPDGSERVKYVVSIYLPTYPRHIGLVGWSICRASTLTVRHLLAACCTEVATQTATEYLSMRLQDDIEWSSPRMRLFNLYLLPFSIDIPRQLGGWPDIEPTYTYIYHTKRSSFPSRV